MSDCPQLLTPVQQKHIQRQNNINQRRHKDGNFKKQQLQDEADKVLYKLGLMSLNGELWIKCGKNLDSYRLIVTSGHKVRNKLGLKSLNDEFWIKSVVHTPIMSFLFISDASNNVIQSITDKF